MRESRKSKNTLAKKSVASGARVALLDQDKNKAKRCDCKRKYVSLGFLGQKKIVVDIESVEQVQPVCLKRVKTYFQLTGSKLGLLLNFNVPVLKQGIHRIVLGLEEQALSSWFSLRYLCVFAPLRAFFSCFVVVGNVGVDLGKSS